MAARPWCTFTATAVVAVRTRSMARSSSGTPPTGHSGLGCSRLSGRRRRPSPAASTTAHSRRQAGGAPSGPWGMIAGMTTIVQGIQGLRDLVGQHLGSATTSR